MRINRRDVSGLDALLSEIVGKPVAAVVQFFVTPYFVGILDRRFIGVGRGVTREIGD